MTDGDCVSSEIIVPGTPVRLHHRAMQRATGTSHRLLIIHGYGEHGGRYVPLMRWMAERGIACETFDLRGHGLSSGRRGFIRRWDEYLDDVEAVLAIRNQAASRSAPPLFVLGHSHGGLIAAAAGERGILDRAGAAGCVLSSPYLHSLMPIPAAKRLLGHIAHYVAPALRVPTGMQAQWLTNDATMVAEDRADPLMHHFATPRWYITKGIAQKRVRAEAASFKVPLLCLAGEADIIADPKATTDFYRGAGSADGSLYVYPGMLHELLREAKRDAVFGDVLRWMRAR